MHLIWALAGCMLTILIQFLGYSPVIASSLVGIMASCLAILLKDMNTFSASAFCGSFAGMTSLSLIFGQENHFLYKKVLFLCFLLSLMFGLIPFFILKTKEDKLFFHGYGGRLGVMAFFSVVIFIACKSFFYKEIPFKFFSLSFINANCLFIILISCLAALLTTIFSNYLKISVNSNYKILVSSLLTFCAYFIFYKFSNNLNLLSQAFYAGTFVGMSSVEMLSKRHTLAAGSITGFILAFSENMFKGIGGKLGLTAFISVLLVLKTKELYVRLKK